MAELRLEKCQSFLSSGVREELNSILFDRSALNISHLESINKWLFDDSVLTALNPENALLAFVYENVLVLIDMDNTVCFQSGLCYRSEEIIKALTFIDNKYLIIGTIMGNIYIVDCLLNRVVFHSDMSLTPIIQVFVYQGFVWILSEDAILVKIPLTMLMDSIVTNYHAFMECDDISRLPVVECGTIPQQRYLLQGQSSIQSISICVVPKHDSHSINETPSSDESPSVIKSPDSAFKVIAVGSYPFLCFYEISLDTPNVSVGSIAVSVAKSLYGAVRSLAGWGWSRAEAEQATPLPKTKNVHKSQEVTDNKRSGIQIWGSPSGRYVVINDSLNRLTLVDAESGEVLYMWKGYRKVQCFWSTMSVTLGNDQVSVPQSANRNYIEVYRVPSMVRCVNLHFPHPAHFYQIQNDGYVVYEAEGIPTSVVCSSIQVTASSMSFQSSLRLALQHDIILKNTAIKLLQSMSEVSKKKPGEEQSTLPASLVDSLQDTIQLIKDPQMYLRLLDDCFRYGIDLSQSYKTLLSICSQHVESLCNRSSSQDLSSTSKPFNSSEVNEEINPSKTANLPLVEDDMDDDIYEVAKDVLQRLLFYSSLISWYFSVLTLSNQRDKSQQEDTSYLIDQSSCELLQFQKAYQDQFVTSPESPAPSFTYKDLSLWLQCIQSSSPRRIRSVDTLSRAARVMINKLLFDTIFQNTDTISRFFEEFGDLQQGDETRTKPCLFVGYFVEWVKQLPFLDIPNAFFERFESIVPQLYQCVPGGSLSPLEIAYIQEAVETSISPGISLLLCKFLSWDLEQKDRTNEARQLVYQVRSVTVLSMAVNNRLNIRQVKENTVQYYLALLNVPVEYSAFDNPAFTIEFDNWKNLLEVALHPSHHYISLLAMFLPSSYFYTIFVQIVVNRLNKLEAPDFAYLLRVLKALPVAKQFAFARFCWRIISSYVVDEIRSDIKNNRDLLTFAQFIENTRQLTSLILSSADKLVMCPELASSDINPSQEDEAAVILDNYPFPITKGCYLTIERNYSTLFTPEQMKVVSTAVDVCNILSVATKLKISKEVPIAVIPTIAQMAPFWEEVFSPTFYGEIPTTIDKSVRYRRTKFVKLCLPTNVDCKSICQALGISIPFFTILRACLLCIAGKDEKADRLCRGAMKELTEEEKKDSVYELSSVVQAFVQESIQWTNQMKRLSLFDELSDTDVEWLDSHPSSGKVTSPSLTTSISMMRRLLKYMPEDGADALHMNSLITQLGKIIEKINQ